MNAADDTFEARLEAATDGWVKPEPALPPPLPEFPTKHLPRVLADMADATSREVQTPVAMAGVLILAMAASTLAGKVQVVGRPGHVEELPLWMFVSAESAERKTPVFNLLRKPLIAFELNRAREVEAAREREQIRLEVIEHKLAKLKKTAKENGYESVAEELAAVQAERDQVVIPAPMRLWVSSPTPEAVHDLLSKHEGRMSVFADEGGLFGILAGRYAGRSGGADLDPFLSGFVGSPLRAPRVTAERKDVAAAFLTMGFAVQPSVLAAAGAVEGAESKGLLGRFLFAMPPSKVGERPYGGSSPVPTEVMDAYADLLTLWANLAVPTPRHRLSMSHNAFQTYEQFHDSIEQRLRPGGDLADIPSWGGKIAGTTLRVAAVLHCFEQPSALFHKIEQHTIAAAIGLTEEFFIPHAFAAFAVLRQGAAQSVTRRLVTWITTRRLTDFTVNQAFKALSSGSGGSVQNKADILPGLDQLEIAGYIRRGEAKRADSVRYEVNPLWNYA